MDQTGEWRKGTIEATFGTGIQEEKGLTKSTIVERSLKIIDK